MPLGLQPLLALFSAAVAGASLAVNSGYADPLLNTANNYLDRRAVVERWHVSTALILVSATIVILPLLTVFLKKQHLDKSEFRPFVLSRRTQLTHNTAM